jgi:hypothetical protein
MEWPLRRLAHAQAQQSWVAYHNSGIINGSHQAVKMALDAAGNVYVTSCFRTPIPISVTYSGAF